jgi:hypothetical protein
MDRITFLRFFDIYGDNLLKGWLRAKEDGSKEAFSEWVLGEYDSYLHPALRDSEGNLLPDNASDGEEDPAGSYREDYEVPYHGILDHPSKAEKVIYNEK